MGVAARCKHLLAGLLLLVQLIPGTAASAPLVVAVEDAAPPWSNRDGTGFANEIVQTAFKAVGVEVEFSVVPYARCKNMVLTGKVAACFSMSWLPQFTGKIRFSEQPLFVCHTDFITSRKKPLNATREEELPKGTLVGVVHGYEYPPSIYALQDRGIVVFEEAESDESNLRKLAKGRLDAVLLANTNEINPLDARLARAGLQDQVQQAFHSGTLQSHIGFSTRHPQGTWARHKFDQGYRIISANGTRRNIEQRWKTLALTEAAKLTEKANGPHSPTR